MTKNTRLIAHQRPEAFEKLLKIATSTDVLPKLPWIYLPLRNTTVKANQVLRLYYNDCEMLTGWLPFDIVSSGIAIGPHIERQLLRLTNARAKRLL